MRYLALLLLAASSSCSQFSPEDRDGDAVRAQSEKALLPRPAGPVGDFAQIITTGEEEKLDRRLRGIFARKQTAVVVVTVHSLAGQDVAQFTRALANQWHVGGSRGGVMILIAPNERKVRIEIDRKVQRRLSNERCAELIKESFLPHFRSGDYEGGIAAGVEAIRPYL